MYALTAAERGAAALLRRIAAELIERAAALEAEDGVGPMAQATRLADASGDEDDEGKEIDA